MAQPAINRTNPVPTPHQDSTSISLKTNPTSNSNEGVAKGLLKNQESAPPLMKAIGELQSLTNVLQTFHSKWDELQTLVTFIENAIESKEKELVTLLPSDPPKNSSINTVSNENESPSLTINDNTTSNSPGIQNLESKQKNPKCEEKPPTSSKTENTSESELVTICYTMSSRELRRYITRHLAESSKLREEVPLALKHAPNPARLILTAIGKFYVQRHIAVSNKIAMVSIRNSSLLILEYFLLMGPNIRMVEPMKDESKQAVLAWKKRLVREGGLSRAGMQDARGLLLFVGCFGIPDELSNDDLFHLLRIGNARDISEALRKSSFLLARVPDIVEYSLENGMTVEALDIVYTFGVEDDEFSQKILSPFVKSLKDGPMKAEGEAKGSPAAQKGAIENQLSLLKSLLKCLKAHKVDPAKVMPGWNLKEKIANLEKDIAELNEKVVSKRKANEHNSTAPVTPNSIRPKVDQITPNFKRSKFDQEPLASVRVPVPGPVQPVHTPLRMPVQPVHTPPPLPSPFSSLVDPRAPNQQGYQIGSRFSDPAHSPWQHRYGTMGVPNRGSALRPSFGASMPSGSSFHERPVDHHFVGSAEVGGRSFVGPSSLSEGYRVAPKFGGASQSSSADLYSFADVIDGGYARSAYKSGDASGVTSYRPT